MLNLKHSYTVNIKCLWICSLMNLIFLLIVVNNLYFRKSQPYVLSVVHINDFHDRFDEITLASTPCRPNMTNCIGGFSRTFAALSHLRSTLPNPIVLNAGDNFVGTLWYKYYQWNVTQTFMNLLNFDAVTVGNHDFANGIQGLVSFMHAMKAPFVLSNVNASAEPNFEKSNVRSVVLNRNGKRIGIMAILRTQTMETSRVGKLQLLDEVISTRKEARCLKNEKHCDIIIVMSHCGKEVDEKIAKDGGPYINVVVGGHSHDLYYNGDSPKGIKNPSSGYPAVITQENGRKVLVVQSRYASKFVGHLTVMFDKNNEVVNWEGNSEYMGRNQPKDPVIDNLLSEWKKKIDDIAFAVVGKAETNLTFLDCKLGECKLGSYFADAMLDGWNNGDRALVNISIINGGAVRGDINIGDILYMDLIGAMPFEDKLAAFEIQGDDLHKTLEYASTTKENDTIFFANDLLQVSGIEYVINASKPNGNRVESVKIRCENEFETLSMQKTYRIVAPEFFLNDVNGYGPVPKLYKNKIENGPELFDSLLNYTKKNRIIKPEKSGRITVVR